MSRSNTGLHSSCAKVLKVNTALGKCELTSQSPSLPNFLENYGLWGIKVRFDEWMVVTFWPKVWLRQWIKISTSSTNVHFYHSHKYPFCSSSSLPTFSPLLLFHISVKFSLLDIPSGAMTLSLEEIHVCPQNLPEVLIKHVLRLYKYPLGLREKGVKIAPVQESLI